MGRWLEMSTKWLSSRSFKAAVLLGVAITVYKAGETGWLRVRSSQHCPDTMTSGQLDTHTHPVLRNFSFDAKPPSTPEVKLLILSYMRSGSTFTGDVFNQNPDAFYVYEPLHITDGSFLKGNKPDLAMFWSWPKREPPSRLEMQDEILTAYFNCTFNHVYVGAITDWVMRMANRTNLFFNCLRPDAGFSAVLRCLPLLQQSCSGAKAVVVKTIRYTMERALTLMENDPKVKVIHLVRDPRATLYSRHWLGLVPTRAVSNVSATFCRQVAAELQLGDVISERFPGRLLLVRYEDLARQPLLQASRLLRFAGLQLSPQQAQHLDSVTSAASKLSHSNRIGVKKTNSSFTASAWRDDSSFSFASSVDAQCREAYQLAGYLPLDSEAKLRDHEVSSMLGMEQVARLRGQ